MSCDLPYRKCLDILKRRYLDQCLTLPLLSALATTSPHFLRCLGHLCSGLPSGLGGLGMLVDGIFGGTEHLRNSMGRDWPPGRNWKSKKGERSGITWGMLWDEMIETGFQEDSDHRTHRTTFTRAEFLRWVFCWLPGQLRSWIIHTRQHGKS